MKENARLAGDRRRLLTGLYVSRVDDVNGGPVTTFDIRMTCPGAEPPMETAAVCAIERLGDGFLRGDPDWRGRVVHFGPMGCRTGFCMILAGSHEPEQILDLVARMFEFIRDYEGEIPGDPWMTCGSCQDPDLPMAKHYAQKYLAEVVLSPDPARFHYPA